jgi:cathepsin L
MRVALPLLTAAASIVAPRDFSDYTFEQYKAEFGKNYNSDEHDSRREVFEANIKLINQQNADDNKSWFATVNEFTDWTNEEFRAKRTSGRVTEFPGELTAGEPVAAVDLPTELDWRTKTGVMTAVKNQGGCGSCWAFSATETLESHYAIATGETAPVLSPQQVVSCAPNPQKCGGSGGCDGSTQPLAFNYTSTAGLGLESSYPYQGVTGTCDSSKISPVAKNSGYTVLTTNNYTELITAVATKGPVAISVAAGSFGWQLYGGGVYSGSCGFDMDHAVQLVGYGTDSGKDYWLVRNSWGSWGEKGYIRIERFGEGKEPCGVDSTPQDGDACAGDTKPRTYCGLCGILSSSSYPTGVGKATQSVMV